MIVDAAMNDLMRPSLYDAWHAIEAVAPTGERMIADIVGPVCESGDTFAMARDDRPGRGRRPDGHPHRRRLCRDHGEHLQQPRRLPPEVLVNGGEWAVVRERQDMDALIAGRQGAGMARPMTRARRRPFGQRC